jgi:hypothetical protein
MRLALDGSRSQGQSQARCFLGLLAFSLATSISQCLILNFSSSKTSLLVQWNKATSGQGGSSVVQHLPTMHEALDSIFSPEKRKKERTKQTKMYFSESHAHQTRTTMIWFPIQTASFSCTNIIVFYTTSSFFFLWSNYKGSQAII